MTRSLASIVLVTVAGCTSTGCTGKTPDTPDSHDSADTGETASDSGESAGPACPTKGDWIAVEAGNGLTCGIHADGCAECWGLGGDIELIQDTGYGGIFDSGQDEPPRDVAFRTVRLVDLGTQGRPGYHGCGVTLTNQVSCWGRNDYGQLAAPDGEFLDVEVYDRGSCGIRVSGVIECWGQTRAPPEGTFQHLAFSFGIAAALHTSGALTSWALPGLEAPELPETVGGPFVGIGGGSLVAALRADGTLDAWYAGYYAKDLPFEKLLPTVPLASVCAVSTFVCALDLKGTPVCVGPYPDDPSLDPPKGVTFTSLSCGASHVCGVTPDHEIVCWGDLSHGEGTPPS